MKSLNFFKLRRAFTLVEIMIVVLIIGILLAIAIPNFIAAREMARAKACVENLAKLQSATEQYAMDNHVEANVGLSISQFHGLAPDYIRVFPICPSGGSYAPGNTVNDNPTCTISGSALVPTGTGNYAPPTNPGSIDGAGKYYHGLP